MLDDLRWAYFEVYVYGRSDACVRLFTGGWYIYISLRNNHHKKNIFQAFKLVIVSLTA